MASRTTMKGRFIPKNPQKYVGNVDQIFFRSSWEKTMMTWLDTNSAVLRWNSEEIAIPYINPLKVDATGRPVISRYYPDFVIVYRDTTGAIKKEIVEIKPMKETVLTPRASERDKLAYVVNQAKWKAAAAFAETQGASFRVLTESSLFYNPKKRQK